MKSVGVDIGSYSIKVAEVETLSRGYAFTNYYEHVLSTSPAQDQDLEIHEYLRTVAQKYDPSQTRIVVCVNQERISVRNKLFPFRERQKILKSLSFELEDDIPFAPESAIYDAKLIRFTGTQAEVLACAVPKIHVARLFSRCDDAGLTPNVVSGEGLAFQNLFESWDAVPHQVNRAPIPDDSDEGALAPQRDVSVMLHMGHTRTTICFFEGESLISVRSLLWGAKNVSDAISLKYEIPFEAAQREMQNKGFILTMREGATYDQAAFSDVIQASVKDLVKDVQLTFLEAKSQMGCQIRSIHLSGGASQIRNLGAYLTQQFEIPVNKLQTFSRLHQPRFEVSPHIDATSGLACSLAIEGLRRPKNPAINFLRGDFAQQSQRIQKLWQKWGSAAAMAVALILVIFMYSYTRESLSMDSADSAHNLMVNQAKTLAKLPRPQLTVDGVSKWIRNQETKVKDLEKLEGLAQMNSAMDVLSRVNSVIPPKSQLVLEVKNINVSGDRVTIEGWSKGATGTKLLSNAFSKIAIGGKVGAQRSNVKAPAGSQSFSLNFAIDRNIQKKEM